MIKSMTGFGATEAEAAALGKISVELKSSNHKFLDISFHLPDGFLSLEDRIKKEIEAKIKRGRVACAINISRSKSSRAFVNKELLKNYMSLVRSIKQEFKIRDEISINTLIHLPGILSLEEAKIPNAGIWPQLKILLNKALDELALTRKKEGQALYKFLRGKADMLNGDLTKIRVRFKIAVKDKLKQFKTDEERSSFLKGADITEEAERLAFHARNLKNKLAKDGAVGKELDFIAQEMQREANTMAAKSFDAAISMRVVQMKSQIEKIREQVQNIE